MYKTLREIYERYDVLLLDVFGLLYSGDDFFPGVLGLLEEIRRSGRKIIILSNSTADAEKCISTYSKKGLIAGKHFDHFVSSGEAFRNNVKNYFPEAKSYFCLFSRNNSLFKSCNLEESESMENADIIYVGSLVENGLLFLADKLTNKNGDYIPIENITSLDCHDIPKLYEISSILDKCLKLGKTLSIVNPDIFAILPVESPGKPSKQCPVLCQGAIGEFYESLGGVVKYFGKPYGPMFDFAKNFIEDKEKTKIAMVGDTPWTDILGGNLAGFDTILSLTGVSAEFLRSMPQNITNIQEKIEILLNDISVKMTHNSLLSVSIKPTHIIERFA